MTRAHIHGVFIRADVFIHVCETMFTIGESRTISLTQNGKHSRWREILHGEDFPP